MPRSLVKLVAIFLLVVQGAVGLAPGQALCITIQDCGTHERGAHAACGQCDSGGCVSEVGGDNCRNHEHGLFSAAVHPDDDCGCHLHVPLPDHEQAPSNPRGDGSDIRSVVVPLLVAFTGTWDCGPAPAAPQRFKPPDLSATEQVLALKATRLLI